jgi:hypothetical protein
MDQHRTHDGCECMDPSDTTLSPPPSLLELTGPLAPRFIPADLVTPEKVLRDGGATAVLLQIAAAIVKTLIEFSKTIDSVGQIATLIGKLITEMAWLIKKIISEEFVQQRLRTAHNALSAIQHDIRVAALSPNPKELLETLYSGGRFGNALAQFEDLNRDREGLGLPGSLATASLELKVVDDLIAMKSQLVDLGTLKSLRTLHRENAEGAFRRSMGALPDTYEVAGGWHGYIMAEDPRYPIVGEKHEKAVENIDWDRDLPIFSGPVPVPYRMYLGVLVKDPNQRFGWAQVDVRTIDDFRGRFNQRVRTLAPELRTIEKSKEAEAERALLTLTRDPMDTLFKSWDQLSGKGKG